MTKKDEVNDYVRFRKAMRNVDSGGLLELKNKKDPEDDSFIIMKFNIDFARSV